MAEQAGHYKLRPLPKQKGKARILGIDVSTNDIAFTLVEVWEPEFGKEAPRLYITKCFKEEFERNIRLEDKMKYIPEIFGNHDWMIKEDLDYVFIERNLSAKALPSFASKGWYDMCGALFFGFADNGYDVRYIVNNSWKSGLNHTYGFNTKGLTTTKRRAANIAFVNDLFNENIEDNDLADAALIALGAWIQEKRGVRYKWKAREELAEELAK